MAHHNDLRDKVVDLSGKDFTPTHVHDNPRIFVVSYAQRTMAHPARSTNTISKNKSESRESKGNLLIHDLWQNGTDSAHHMPVVHT